MQMLQIPVYRYSINMMNRWNEEKVAESENCYVWESEFAYLNEIVISRKQIPTIVCYSKSSTNVSMMRRNLTHLNISWISWWESEKSMFPLSTPPSKPPRSLSCKLFRWGETQTLVFDSMVMEEFIFHRAGNLTANPPAVAIKSKSHTLTPMP